MEFRVWMFGNEKATVKVINSDDINPVILWCDVEDGKEQQDRRIVASYYVNQYLVKECGESFICINSEFDVYYVSSCACGVFRTDCKKVHYDEAKAYLIEHGKLN